MHFHAEHSLFFERRQPFWVAAVAIALTSGVLMVNAGARSAIFSVVAAVVGAMLLLFARGAGARRIEPALAWAVALVVVALFAGIALGSADAVFETVVRVLCGVIWVLWLGTQVDWASMRRFLLWLRLPEAVVASLDHALMHGALTQREWVQRRDAARLRLGTSRLPLAAWGPLLGEGALQAFTRLERAEENALLRSSALSKDDVIHEGVHLDAVDVERGGQRVLEQVGFRLERTEWLLVCGASGAGKSSLLRLLAGLDGPAQGTMTRLGRRVSSDVALGGRLDGRVALLGQNPEHHFIASTVAEDIAWGLLRRGVETGEASRRSREVAMALRIDHLLERPCHQLSFGEQRRVALAGLLVLEPALLLLDEPTAGLDPVAAHELRTLVEASVRRTNAACIWATHDLGSLPPQAQRVVLLRDRQLIFDGTVKEGLSKPWLVRAGLAVPSGEQTPC